MIPSPIFGDMRIQLLFLISILLLSACIVKVPVVEEEIPPIMMETAEVEAEFPEYQPAPTKVNDLIHTRLDIAFDWEKHYLIGTATLDLSPYFYATNRLQLDAKGFDIDKVALVTDSGWVDLEYDYNNRVIDITLDKTYSRIETYQVLIKYTAKPDELPIGGSNAITSDKGLYFINTDSTEVGKPTQIWTQGQTESSSCWFPTIDAPNERTTQEMYINVDHKYKTLSNGELIYSNFNADGTRTDYWKMDQDHPPYLFMMAVGDFVVAHDKWVNSQGDEIPVTYWVEADYGKYAYKMFGATPEMMTFFSELLNFDYPWAKYSQVVVRDYVSGAMENTTATIHGEFLNQTDRDLLDGNNEDIIAHELFHHWFGDLVTCESWANLPLNESFATYGEYLWDQYKYGQDAADLTMMYFRDSYFREAFHDPKHLIRYYYDDKEDMFDSHSYQKGACILHMLRRQVGDEAFFLALNKYLVDHQYKDAEVHNLRLAFEEITGADLQWFFDQWFLGKGHPKVNVDYHMDSASNEVSMLFSQTQEGDPFILPFKVEIYTTSGTETVDCLLTESTQSFTWATTAEPLWVKVDPTHDLLAEWNVSYTLDQNISRFKAGGDLFSRLYPLEEFFILDQIPEENRAQFDVTLVAALSDPHAEVRLAALDLIGDFGSSNKQVRNRVLELLDDKNTDVTAAAMLTMITGFDYKDEKPYIEALGNQSYRVMSAGLEGLGLLNPQLALARAKALETETKPEIIQAVSQLYAEEGNSSHDQYFISNIENGDTYQRYLCTMYYGSFLYNQGDEAITSGVDYLLGRLSLDDRISAYSARVALSGLQKDLSMDLELLGEGEEARREYLTTTVNKIADGIAAGS